MVAINFSGLASGIDSQALIKSLSQQIRQARELPLKEHITDLTDTNSAFDELAKKLNTLKDAAYKFRAISGGAVAKLATSTDETVLTASSNNSALNSSFTATVSQIATNGTYSFDDKDISSTSDAIAAGISASDTIKIVVGTGSDAETINLNVDKTTSLDQLASDFNAASSKATASVVNTGTSTTPSYKLVFNSNNQGTEQGSISVSVGGNITALGRFTSATTRTAQDAEFTISGISGTITRSTNQITDVIQGLTLNLNKAGTSTVKVSNDTATTTQTVQDFVDAFNDLTKFVKENNLITRQDDGSNSNTAQNIFGPLAKSSVDNNALSAIRSALSSATKSGGSVNVLADLGISTQRDGTLKFDTAQFNAALFSEPDSVQTISENLGENLAAVDGTIAKFTQFNGLIDSAISGNKSQITAYQDSINQIEKGISKQEDALTSRFSRLEALISQMNSQQQQLSSLLGGLH